MYLCPYNMSSVIKHMYRNSNRQKSSSPEYMGGYNLQSNYLQSPSFELVHVEAWREKDQILVMH